MPYYKDINILFIHIPKTGGTTIEEEIKKKYNQTLYEWKWTNDILPFPYNKKSLQHQFIQTIINYRNKLGVNFNNRLKVFTIVRNPYDKIISDLFWFKLIKKDSTPEQVFNIIKTKYLYNNNLDNHNEPQWKFISNSNGIIYDKIKIFHTEKLHDSNDEINKFLGIKINTDNKKMIGSVKNNYNKYLNNNSKELIYNFYRKDFELFNYQK